MGRLIHHVWESVTPTRLLKHKRCVRCNCEQYYSAGYGRVVYQDRFGKIWFRAPQCELTTKFV